MERSRVWPRESELVPFRMRTIAIGIQATGLILAIMLVWWFLSDPTPMAPETFWSLWGITALGAVVASRLPWQRLLASGKGLWLLYASSAAAIVLISLLIGAMKDSFSPVFFLYALTTIFFAMTYPLAGQIALGAFTTGAFLLTIFMAGIHITIPQIVMRFGLLGALGFVASFISRELIAHIGYNLEESRRAEDLFRAISELTSDYAYSMRVEPGGSLSWEWVTGAFESVTGYTFEEAKMRGGWQTLIHPDDLARAGEEFEHLMATGQKNVTDLRLIHKSGETRWVRAYVRPVVEDGSIVKLIGAVEDITDAKQRETVLERAHEERRRLVTHLVRAKEAERARLASDIHDDTIQIMTSVAIGLESGARRVTDPEQRHLFGRLEDAVRAAIARLRSMVFELRPPELDQEGLLSAVRLCLEELRVDLDISYDLHIGIDAEPDPGRREVFYRVAKEALTNVRKHSQARHVDVYLERSDQGLLLRISDDGVGVRPHLEGTGSGHFGLSEMRERSEMLGGWFRVGRNDPRGATIECWVPDEAAVSVT